MHPYLFLDLVQVLDMAVQSGANTSPYAVLGFMVASSLSVLAMR